jgi:hypothetical protein
MKKRELKLALRSAGRIALDNEFFLIGSQAIHAYCDRPPAEVTLSQECDLYPKNRPETAHFLDAKLGRGSRFARRHGFYVDVVTPELATLPASWERRLQPLRAGTVTALCLEVHDLVISKLAAGRLKDLEFVGALFRLGLAKPRRVSLRIKRLVGERDRARLRSRLQAVLDDLG